MQQINREVSLESILLKWDRRCNQTALKSMDWMEPRKTLTKELPPTKCWIAQLVWLANLRSLVPTHSYHNFLSLFIFVYNLKVRLLLVLFLYLHIYISTVHKRVQISLEIPTLLHFWSCQMKVGCDLWFMTSYSRHCGFLSGIVSKEMTIQGSLQTKGWIGLFGRARTGLLTLRLKVQIPFWSNISCQLELVRPG